MEKREKEVLVIGAVAVMLALVMFFGLRSFALAEEGVAVISNQETGCDCTLWDVAMKSKDECCAISNQPEEKASNYKNKKIASPYSWQVFLVYVNGNFHIVRVKRLNKPRIIVWIKPLNCQGFPAGAGASGYISEAAIGGAIGSKSLGDPGN